MAGDKDNSDSSFALPPWAREIISLYESSSTSQFILYGNIHDRFLLPLTAKSRLGSLSEFLMEVLLQRFDVVLGFDLGNGLRVEKGYDTFCSWPGLKGMSNLPRGALLAIDLLTHYLRYCANLGQIQSSPGSRKLKVACMIQEALHLLEKILTDLQPALFA